MLKKEIKRFEDCARQVINTVAEVIGEKVETIKVGEIREDIRVFNSIGKAMESDQSLEIGYTFESGKWGIIELIKRDWHDCEVSLSASNDRDLEIEMCELYDFGGNWVEKTEKMLVEYYNGNSYM